MCFIEIFENWKKISYESLLYDGLHPNSEGHKKIFETVKNYLVKNKII
jgi:lysophospholipase L1-like esterase